jgi:hypothetical protein
VVHGDKELQEKTWLERSVPLRIGTPVQEVLSSAREAMMALAETTSFRE